MNKKRKGNMVLIGLALILGLTLFDFSPRNTSYESEIRAFILSNLDNGVEYKGKDFYEINEAFLLSQDAVRDPFEIVKDSIRNQLNLIKTSVLADLMAPKVAVAQTQFEALNLSTTSDYLLVDIDLKREIAKHSSSQNLLEELNKEEAKMNQGIALLNEVLDTFNLSIYSLNFENSETISFLHSFSLSTSKEVQDHIGVFELSKDSKNVVSFKEI